MAEETIWRGTSSQLKNLGYFIWCGIFCLLGIAIFIALTHYQPGIAGLPGLCGLLVWLFIPIILALARYLQTKNNVFELTSERIKMTEGIFSKVTETLELYLVKDIEVRQPFSERLVGVENIQINTSDMSSPVVLLEAIPKSVGLADKLRNQVEIIRALKKVREIDLE